MKQPPCQIYMQNNSLNQNGPVNSGYNIKLVLNTRSAQCQLYVSLNVTLLTISLLILQQPLKAFQTKPYSHNEYHHKISDNIVRLAPELLPLSCLKVTLTTIWYSYLHQSMLTRSQLGFIDKKLNLTRQCLLVVVLKCNIMHDVQTIVTMLQQRVCDTLSNW